MGKKKEGLKKKTRKMGEHVVDLLDMPQEVVLDVPKLICTGQKHIIIENHKGIIEYTTTRIRISISLGEVQIEGNNLQVNNIVPEKLEISGTVKNISFR